MTTTNGATVLMDNQYGRDATGKIKTITGLTANDNWVYDYDLRGRLISADNAGNNALDETYAYADNNNLTFRTRIGAYAYLFSRAGKKLRSQNLARGDVIQGVLSDDRGLKQHRPTGVLRERRRSCGWVPQAS